MLNLALGFTFRLTGNRLPTDGTATLDLDFTAQVETASLDLDFTTQTYQVRPDDTGGVVGQYIAWS
jgi:hypothetical protein